MKKIDLNSFMDWQREKSSRHVTIELGRSGDKKYMRAWAYDYDLQTGQHVKSVDEINLEKEKEDSDKELYEKLKARFGGE